MRLGGFEVSIDDWVTKILVLSLVWDWDWDEVNLIRIQSLPLTPSPAHDEPIMYAIDATTTYSYVTRELGYS